MDCATASGDNPDHIMQVLLDREERDLMEVEQSLDDNICENRAINIEPDNEQDELVSLDGQQYKRYKSFAILKQHHNLGLPLSFVIVNVGNDSIIGFVVGNQQVLHLVPIRIGNALKQSTHGFAYFLTSIDIDSATWVSIGASASTGDTSFVNYGHLLPHLPTIGQSDVLGLVPYAVVTLDGDYMDDRFEFI